STGTTAATTAPGVTKTSIAPAPSTSVIRLFHAERPHYFTLTGQQTRDKIPTAAADSPALAMNQADKKGSELLDQLSAASKKAGSSAATVITPEGKDADLLVPLYQG
ncbi:hypothetical protein BGW38_003572, partial [Lunasporangiospora selenospora]